MDFIWAAANIRASEYKIRTVDRLESKLIAGNIIPAIVTTTSLVTGLVCLEMYKVLQGKPFAAYRNSFVNLANCIFQSAEPIAPTKHKFIDDKEYTEWDFIDVKRGDITLGAFLKYMKVCLNIPSLPFLFLSSLFMYRCDLQSTPLLCSFSCREIITFIHLFIHMYICKPLGSP